MDIRAVILDCDGVIIDSFREGLHRIKIICAMNDVPFDREARKRLTDLWGAPGVVLLEKGLQVSKKLAERMYKKWEQMDLADPVHPIPGAREVLFWLGRSEFARCLLTSRNKENITDIFEVTDFLRYFEIMCTKQDVKYAKPHPRAFDVILDELKEKYDIAKNQCVFVGDTPSDIVAGEAAGILTLVVQTGPYLLKHTKNHPMELENILQSIDDLPMWLEEHCKRDLKYLYK